MSYDNIKLWFAKNKNEEILTIDDINDANEKDVFSCPICGSQVRPRARKSKKNSPHFVHHDAEKCNSETMIHWWFKHKFIETGDSFTIIADEERHYICKEIQTEQSYIANDKVYKPDITVLTECGNTIYFEMAFSNKKKVQDYLDTWITLKNIVVEVDVKKLLRKDESPTFKALFYMGKCFNVKKNDLYYNTIGRYKENKLQSNVDDQIRERIRKLDWFWVDVLRYKRGEVGIPHLAELIDSIDGDEKHVLYSLLKKSMCSELYNDYKKFKSLDEFYEFNGNYEEDTIIEEAINSLNHKYKNIDVRYDVKIHKKAHYDYSRYYKGTRRNPYGYRKSFSHYTYTILIKYNNKIIDRFNITNRNIKTIFSDKSSIQATISEIIEKNPLKFRCLDCNNTFQVEFGEVKFFNAKRFSIPRRCKCCRKKRKHNS